MLKMLLSPMRAVLSIIVFSCLSMPVLMADIQPAATSLMGTAGSLTGASVAAATQATMSAPDNLFMRAFAMVVGILLLGIAFFTAFTGRPKAKAVKVMVQEKE